MACVKTAGLGTHGFWPCLCHRAALARLPSHFPCLASDPSPDEWKTGSDGLCFCQVSIDVQPCISCVAQPGHTASMSLSFLTCDMRTGTRGSRRLSHGRGCVSRERVGRADDARPAATALVAVCQLAFPVLPRPDLQCSRSQETGQQQRPNSHWPPS